MRSRLFTIFTKARYAATEHGTSPLYTFSEQCYGGYLGDDSDTSTSFASRCVKEGIFPSKLIKVCVGPRVGLLHLIRADAVRCIIVSDYDLLPLNRSLESVL